MNAKKENKKTVEVTDKVRCNNCMAIFDEDTIECSKCHTDEYFMQPFVQELSTDKYRKIKDGKGIVDSLDFLIENGFFPEIETWRFLGDEAAKYIWRMNLYGDIELSYMDKTITIPKGDFDEVWDKEYAKGMYYPPLEGGQITLLGDGSSWVVDVAATVYQLDQRFAEYMVTSDKGYDDLDHYPALAEPTHSLDQLIDQVGNFDQSEIITLFEVARYALSDAGIFDEVCSDMDIADSDMKKLQEKLEEHMETQRT